MPRLPRAAIASGCADIVAPPAELPARILDYMARLTDAPPADPVHGTIDKPSRKLPANALQSIFSLLQQRTRHDFSLYKPSTLHRRIERRMAIHAVATPALYADFLLHNPQEIDLLFKELLIGVTSFFRDPAVWLQLADVTLPELLARQAAEHKLRAWVIGCSTGEEAYSLAMVFAEVLERLPQYQGCNLQVFASDLSPDAIATARRGDYPASISDAVSPQRLAKFFTARDGHYRINKSIRDCVLFARHNVILDPPFGKLDLLSCRNLMIYFDAALQRRLLPLFHYSLRPGGVLLLGSSETIGRFHHLFAPLEAKLRLYQREDSVTVGSPDFLLRSFPPLSRINKETFMSPPPAAVPAADNLQTAADRVLLQVYAPAAVVVSGGGDIVYISGHTGKYLEPAAGKANWNFHAMARDGLRAPLADALKQAVVQSEAVTLRGLEVRATGGVQKVDVTVQALREPAALQGMLMVVFRDVAPPRRGAGAGRPARQRPCMPPSCSSTATKSRPCGKRRALPKRNCSRPTRS